MNDKVELFLSALIFISFLCYNQIKITSIMEGKILMANTIKLNIKNANSKFAAIDLSDWKNVIAEGNSVESVVKKAKKSGNEYFTMFVPKKSKTYIFGTWRHRFTTCLQRSLKRCRV